MVSQWIRLIECNYFEITILMITLDSRVISFLTLLPTTVNHTSYVVARHVSGSEYGYVHGKLILDTALSRLLRLPSQCLGGVSKVYNVEIRGM